MVTRWVAKHAISGPIDRVILTLGTFIDKIDGTIDAILRVLRVVAYRANIMVISVIR